MLLEQLRSRFNKIFAKLKISVLKDLLPKNEVTNNQLHVSHYKPKDVKILLR
jgi:hypothetical protein